MRRRHLLAASLAATMLAAAAPDPGLAVLQRLFTAPQVDSAWFTSAFLSAVPLEQVRGIVDQVKSQMGAFKSVTGGGTHFVVHFASGDVTATLHLAADGRIAGLLLRPGASNARLEDHLRMLASLPGTTSWLVTSGTSVLAAKDADRPLAVGSAFKLAVLKAVRDRVEAGTLAWDRAAPLKAEWRSWPSGILQTWPAGIPVTVGTLAALMISQSDNTAADALIDLAGRERVEAISPRNTPFLTTREAFLLKADLSLATAWRGAGPDARRRLLGDMARNTLPGDAPDALPAGGEDIEWFMTARELASLLDELSGLPAFGINPGLAKAADWRDVAFKGGSETGVVNLSTRVVGQDGIRHSIVVTWNGSEASPGQLMVPYSGLLDALSRRSAVQ